MSIQWQQAKKCIFMQLKGAGEMAASVEMCIGAVAGSGPQYSGIVCRIHNIIPKVNPAPGSTLSSLLLPLLLTEPCFCEINVFEYSFTCGWTCL